MNPWLAGLIGALIVISAIVVLVVLFLPKWED